MEYLFRNFVFCNLEDWVAHVLCMFDRTTAGVRKLHPMLHLLPMI